MISRLRRVVELDETGAGTIIGPVSVAAYNSGVNRDEVRFIPSVILAEEAEFRLTTIADSALLVGGMSLA